MNLNTLRGRYFLIAEVLPFGRTAEINGVLCHVIGLVRYTDRSLRLLALQYDDNYRDILEQAEIEALNRYDGPARTNRESCRSSAIEPNLPLGAAALVSIGGREFRVPESECSICDAQDNLELAMMFSIFFENGWDPAGIDMPPIRDMFITSLKFDGEYDAMPSLDLAAPIRITMHEQDIARPVELPLTLDIGGEYPDKLEFCDKATGEHHWVRINSVELHDMRADFEKQFNSPEFAERMSPEELKSARAHIMQALDGQYPRGEFTVVVEYECDTDITLQFALRHWLDEDPGRAHRRASRHCGGSGISPDGPSAVGVIGGSGTTTFIMLPDKPIGALGLRLKADAMLGTVPAGTTVVEAELFQYLQRRRANDINI